MNEVELSRTLGWLSIGLGLTKLVAARTLAEALGRPDAEPTIRGFGARGVATGVSIVSNPVEPGGLWARVAGDALDIACLSVVAADTRNAKRGNALLTLTAVAGLTLLDLATARALQERSRRALATARRTRITGRNGDFGHRSRDAEPSREALHARSGRQRPERRVAPERSYVRYTPDVEQIEPGEQETFERIIDVMAGGGRVMRERYGRSVRTSHAKAHGLLKGEIQVLDDLPPVLRQGLFATPRAYPVIVRLAHVPGELLDDRKVSTPRGMALKILDVRGEMVPGHEGELTQDWVLDTGRVFISPGAKTFLAQITATELATPLPEGVKAAVSTASRAANRALNAVGLDSANLDFYGHPFTHPLAEPYYSQTPFRYGDHIAKLRVRPDTASLRALATLPLDLEDENGVRTKVVEHFRHHGVEFEIAIQLCTNLDRMPVEDAAVEWPEEESPYQPVARLILPAQDAYTPARQQFVDEELLFCPAHSLAAHRPLGSIMRARMKAYEVLGRRRREENGLTAREPRNIDEMPG